MNNRKQKIKRKVKQHIPKDWLCDLRIAYRITMEAVNDIRRTGVVNLVIITTMAAILSIFGTLFRTTISMSTLAHEMGNILQVSVYLKNDTQPTLVADKLVKLQNVSKVNIIPKDVSWKNLRRNIDLPDISNPLPDTLHVRVNKPSQIPNVIKQINSVPEVESTGYEESLSKKIQFMTHVVNTATAIVTIIVAMLTIMIINNTIELVIQSRKEEIEVMRLMGVSNWYIKIPLVMQGAFYGFVGSLIAIIPVNIVQNSLENVHKFLFLPSLPYAEILVVITLLVVGISCGAGGSFISIKKHLQV